MQDTDEIDLRGLFTVLWRDRWLIVVIVGVFVLAAAIAAWVFPKKYQATIVVSPVSLNANGGSLSNLGSLASQFGGLASLAGITIGDDSARSEAIAVLQSEELTRRYIGENQLLPILFASSWDAAAGKWKTSDPDKMPTPWKANQFFKKQVRRVTEDKKSGLLMMTITWRDPVAAAEWANGLVSMTNSYLRDKKIRQSERNIAYLNAEAAKTDVVEVRTAIYAILETEVKTMMLARGSEEYALKIVDPAVAPERPASPQAVLWVFAGLVVGAVVAVILVLARKAWAESAATS